MGDNSQERWRLIDAQLDAVWLNRLQLDNGMREIGLQRFPCRNAWAHSRSGEINPELFGISFAVDSLVATRYRGNDRYAEGRDGRRSSALDHAAAGVRLMPCVHRRVPLIAAQGGQRGGKQPVFFLADVLV